MDSNDIDCGAAILEGDVDARIGLAFQEVAEQWIEFCKDYSMEPGETPRTVSEARARIDVASKRYVEAGHGALKSGTSPLLFSALRKYERLASRAAAATEQAVESAK